jgi:ribonuclease H / adenosylcobalamin/alpha-ribazole phosphatase
LDGDVEMLYVIRHAETTHNAEGRIRGMDDPGLTPKGRSEAAGVGKTLAGKVDRVVTDGMKRTQQTAKIAFPNHTAEIDKGLTTLDVGKYRGKKTSPSVEKEFNSQYVAHPEKKIPGGESVNHWLPKIKSTYEKYLGQSRNQNIALVTHGRPMHAVTNGFKPEAAREGGVPKLASVLKVGSDKVPREVKIVNSNPSAPQMKLSQLARV